MITAEQEKWLAHLPDDNAIKILPYDPASLEIFGMVKQKIQKSLGKKMPVLLRGAAGLKISGAGELDIQIPVPIAKFNEAAKKLAAVLGKPKSLYVMARARFVEYIKGIKVEIILINQDSDGWKNSEKFENYLKNHRGTLAEYEKLKESLAGSSTQKYYRAKIEFINAILDKCASI